MKEKYVLKRTNLGEAIFDQTGKQISQWWDEVESIGLREGTTIYYLSTRYNSAKDITAQAIFHIDNPNEPISQWHSGIRYGGLLIDDSSDYYVAFHYPYKHSCAGVKFAIFHKDYPDEPVSKWHDLIGDLGLINNTSQCYVAKANNYPYFQVYHVDNPDIPIYELPFTNIGIEHILHVNSGFTVLYSKNNLVIYSAISNQIEKIAKLPSEFASSIKRVRHFRTESGPWRFYHQDILIAKHVQDGFIPIILHGEGIIYNTKGKILEQYDVHYTPEAVTYATQFIKEYKEKYNSINMIAP